MKTTPLQTQTLFFDIASKQHPFIFSTGESFDQLQIAYETYGQLNAKKNNAILLFHALSGSQHAAGITESVDNVGERWTEECKYGWWDAFIGPRKALDTNKYFIICVNYLGGCYGSSGPTSINPKTNKPYQAEFPVVLAADVVKSQHLLIEHLGIKDLHAVAGASVGGLLALQYALTYPEEINLIISIASGLKTTVLSRLSLFEQVIAIENDPHFGTGNYSPTHTPDYGLALARMISHKTFVHLDAIESRARREVKKTNINLKWYEMGHPIESYMLHQGKKFVSRFDANTYLRIINLWLRYDLLRDFNCTTYAELFERFKKSQPHVLIFSIDSDYCFYPEEQAELVKQLEQANLSVMHITTHSDKGHDSFLLEPQLYTPHLSYTLNGRWLSDSLDQEDDPAL